ncbi:MAG TPA: serine/threonine-protein kinase [Pseudonocardiaceae bacterium]|nr:serine/threonine-protein kinase [Pseudonocardiaceae bacterium]
MPELAQRYELGELIGRGGMAEVHRGHDRLLDRAVAVKLFWAPEDRAAHQRFDDEAVALARLSHPGLVSIYDVGRLGDRPFLVMEFIDGVSLHSRLLEGPLPLDQVISIGAILSEALAHAHERGVVHRDVKPSNIMLDQDGMPHLTDFGIARLAGAARLTNANEIIGTPAYLAPEQLSGTTASPAVDVYALALVLLECLSGRLEYSADSDLAAALSRLNRPPHIPADLPPAVAGLLAAMTAADPAERPSAAECAAQFLPEQQHDILLDQHHDILPQQQHDILLDQPQDVLPEQQHGVLLDQPQDVLPEQRHDPIAALLSTGDTTVLLPITRSHWRALAASAAGIAAVIVTLVLLLNAQQPSSPAPQRGTDHAQGATVTTQTQPTGPAGANHPQGALVANEHSVVATTTTTAPSTSPATTDTPPVTTTTVPATTTTTAPPTTTSSSSVPPTTTPSPSFAPTATSG